MEYNIIKLLIIQVSHFNCNACTVFQLRYFTCQCGSLACIFLTKSISEFILALSAVVEDDIRRLPANPGKDERVHLVSHFCLKSIEQKQVNFNKHFDNNWINDLLDGKYLSL